MVILFSQSNCFSPDWGAPSTKTQAFSRLRPKRMTAPWPRLLGL